MANDPEGRQLRRPGRDRARAFGRLQRARRDPGLGHARQAHHHPQLPRASPDPRWLRTLGPRRRRRHGRHRRPFLRHTPGLRDPKLRHRPAISRPIGVWIRGASHHLTIRENLIHDIRTDYPGANGGDAHGIAAYGDANDPIHHLTIENNELRDLVLGSSEALVVNGNVDGFTIAGNLVHDCSNIGIVAIGFEGVGPTDALDQARNGVIAGNRVWNIDSRGNPAYGQERSAGGIYVDGGRDITVERNTIHHANLGVELASEHQGKSTSGVVLRSNFIHHCHVVGISIGGYDNRRGRTEHCVIVGNTLLLNDTDGTGTGEFQLQFDTRENVFRNNIVYASPAGVLITNPFTQNTSNILDDNIYYTTGSPSWEWKQISYATLPAFRSASGQESRSILADPGLADVNLPDPHLRPGSIAIDRGAWIAESGLFDLDGQPRLHGPIDIGADESW